MIINYYDRPNQVEDGFSFSLDILEKVSDESITDLTFLEGDEGMRKETGNVQLILF